MKNTSNAKLLTLEEPVPPWPIQEESEGWMATLSPFQAKQRESRSVLQTLEKPMLSELFTD